MRFEADMIGVPVERTPVAELSAMGVAHLAGVGAGLFSWDELKQLDRGAQRFEPQMSEQSRAAERHAWAAAVARARGQAVT